MLEPCLLLATLKGIKETGDGLVYFGSTMGCSIYKRQCKERGWLTEDERLTEDGIVAYNKFKLETLPMDGWAVNWDWKDIPELPEPSDLPLVHRQMIPPKAHPRHFWSFII